MKTMFHTLVVSAGPAGLPQFAPPLSANPGSANRIDSPTGPTNKVLLSVNAPTAFFRLILP